MRRFASVGTFSVIRCEGFAQAALGSQRFTRVNASCPPAAPQAADHSFSLVGHVNVIPQCALKIRHSVLEWPEPRGVTPRRLAAAERVLARERQRLALFASQVLAEQETAEDRIQRIDADNLCHDQVFRDLAAKHWREGRRMLGLLPSGLQAEVLEAWNRSSIPPDAAYFVDFVRRQLRSWTIPILLEQCSAGRTWAKEISQFNPAVDPAIYAGDQRGASFQ